MVQNQPLSSGPLSPQGQPASTGSVSAKLSRKPPSL